MEFSEMSLVEVNLNLTNEFLWSKPKSDKVEAAK